MGEGRGEEGGREREGNICDREVVSGVTRASSNVARICHVEVMFVFCVERKL